MTTLTTKQQELFESLIKLGDSKELALKTVLNQKEADNHSEYYNAYCI